MNLSRDIHATRIASIAIDFLDNVRVEENGCWNWTGSKLPAGYGRLGRFSAHRLSIQLSGVPLPDDMNALHICNRPVCVNPDHLYVGTQADNMQQAAREGRMKGWSGKPAKRCRKCAGLYSYSRGKKFCRPCKKARARLLALRKLDAWGVHTEDAVRSEILGYYTRIEEAKRRAS